MLLEHRGGSICFGLRRREGSRSGEETNHLTRLARDLVLVPYHALHCRSELGNSIATVRHVNVETCISMPSATADTPTRAGSAPSYSVPQERVVSIEHPCIVRNFDNGFKSLGGEHQLKDVSSTRCLPSHELL